MKKILLLLFISILSFSTIIHAQVSIAKWQNSPVIIDGDGSEWGILPRFFNSESNIKYEFRNDADNLYFILKAGDKSIQMQLLRGGFSIRFKLKNQTPARVEIIFQPNKSPELPLTMNDRSDKLMDKTISNPDILQKDTATLDGFLFSNGIISSDKKDGICFARSKSVRELTSYEIQIPLREMFGNKFKLENIATIPLQLQLNVNDLSQNELKKLKGRMDTKRGNGQGMSEGRGMNGGEMGGGLNPGNMNEMQGNMSGNGELQSEMRSSFLMERKSFSKDFMLSSGK